jgi:serine phosphatase RsbU (regulator of sigma subunit)/anti-sigma regulatory factor (Ser/Thr protein kinase)/anti-anti-sigma regulatory factor
MEKHIPPAGRPETVISTFAQLPVFAALFEGPDLVISAVNEVTERLLGRPDPVGRPLSEVAPEVMSQRILGSLAQVAETGTPLHVPDFRVQYTHPDGTTVETVADMRAVPWRRPDGSIAGVITAGVDITDRVRAEQEAEAGRAETQRRYARARDVVTTLQEAMLPEHLPVLPRLQIAGRYLLAEEDGAAGGDWFDALTLPDGTVALVVGDVVGHGVKASAVMGRLRTVLGERLGSGAGLTASMAALDAFAAGVPGAEAATVNVVVLDPYSGHMSYVTAGHPAPLVVSADGSCRRLPATAGGPLGTGSAHAAHPDRLEDDDMIVLYSDGIVERPGLTPRQGAAELAETLTDTALNRALPHNAPLLQVERVCGQTLELLTRMTGHADDVTLLAAQRTEPVPDLVLSLPATSEGVGTVRHELGQWLLHLDARREDEAALQHAVVELVTNAVEHAYRDAAQAQGPDGTDGPTDVLLQARLCDDGRVRVDVTDHGCWREPDLAEPFRGNGLAVAAHFSDDLSVRRGRAGEGSTVTLHRQLRRPVSVDKATTGRARRAHSGTLLVREEPDLPGRLTVSGVVDATTAERLEVALRQATRGGTHSVTLDLSHVVHLASAGVQVLHAVRAVCARNDAELTLCVQQGGAAQQVLSVAALPHTTRAPGGPAGPPADAASDVATGDAGDRPA